MKQTYVATALTLLLLLSLSLLEGCASKAPSGLDQVTSNKQAIGRTDKKLVEAEEKLRDFQKDLKGLSIDFKSSANLALQSKTNEVLERLALRVEQAQLDLKELTIQNRAVGKDLDRRLIEAAKQNDEVSKQ